MAESATEIIKTAEKILSDTFGGQIRLEETDELGGSGRSNVFRCNILEGPPDLPQSVIIKQAVAWGDEVYDPVSTEGPAWRLFNDWAGLQFLTESVGDDSPTPRFYGGDKENGLIVFEDLGSGESLDKLLLGDDSDAAESGLIELTTMLGRMHALTVGKRAEYEYIRDGLGPRWQTPTTTEGLLIGFAQGCNAVGVEMQPGIEDEMPAVAALVTDPGPFDVYTHGDPCPDNNLFVERGLKLIDFEFGDFRHALRDGVYGRIHFPTCWCVNRLPNYIMRRMEDAYRAELVIGCPDAEDDEIFYRAVVEACTYWVVGMFHSLTHRLLDEDDEWGISTVRQRLLLRLEVLVKATEEFGYLEAIGATSRDMLAKLREVWSDVEDMPYYPAFR